MIESSKFKLGGKKAVKLVKHVFIVISDVSTIYLRKKYLVCRANRLLLVKCYDNKKVKSPYNWVISPLTQLQVAYQRNFFPEFGYPMYISFLLPDMFSS